MIEETTEGAAFRNSFLQDNRRVLYRHLEIDSPYNTYENGGLPPGPIANAGRAALEASFFPADSDALFFVVEFPGAKTHTFTSDYDAHLYASESYLSQYQAKD